MFLSQVQMSYCFLHTAYIYSNAVRTKWAYRLSLVAVVCSVIFKFICCQVTNITCWILWRIWYFACTEIHRTRDFFLHLPLLFCCCLIGTIVVCVTQIRQRRKHHCVDEAREQNWHTVRWMITRHRMTYRRPLVAVTSYYSCMTSSSMKWIQRTCRRSQAS